VDLLMSAWSDYVSQIPDLFAWWRLGDAGGATLVDQVGGRDLSVTGGTINAAPGLLPWDDDGAASFPGGNVRATATFGLAATWSWATLFSTTSSGGNRYMLSRGPAVQPGLYLNASNMVVFWPSGGPGLTATSAWNDGQPHLAVITWDGSMMTSFVDGTQRAQVAPTTPANLNFSASALHSLGGFDGSWVGVLDDPFMVARPMSGQEIGELWTAMTTPPPWIDGIDPSSVPAQGGVPVMITGQRFTPDTRVVIR